MGEADGGEERQGSKYDGRVSLFPGREGGGSIDVEVALVPEHMAALELDDEFCTSMMPEPDAAMAARK